MIPSEIMFSEFKKKKVIPREYLKEMFTDDYDGLVRFLFKTATKKYPIKGAPHDKVIEFITTDAWKIF